MTPELVKELAPFLAPRALWTLDDVATYLREKSWNF